MLVGRLWAGCPATFSPSICTSPSLGSTSPWGDKQTAEKNASAARQVAAGEARHDLRQLLEGGTPGQEGVECRVGEQLEQRIYGWGQEVESNAIEVHVHFLRKKFVPGLIVTVRGKGYQLA